MSTVTETNKKPLLEVKGLKQYFPVSRKFTVKAVEDVSFYINPGETYGYFRKNEPPDRGETQK